MKFKKNKKVIIYLALIVVIICALVFGLIYGFNNSNSLTLDENKWIDENKYDVVDIAILNDIPALSYEGEGIFYSYLDFLTKNYSINFNIVPYKLDINVSYDYKTTIVDSVSKNDIELLKDNMVLLTLNNIKYKNIDDINNLKIGVLSTDKQNISNYLNNDTITYVEYNNYADLKNSIISSKTAIEQGLETYDVDAIIVLKTPMLKEIIENDLNIAYHFNDLNKYFVLTTQGNEHLNSIFKKTFNLWKVENYNIKYNETLLNEYYNFKKISDVDQKTLKSKNYVYGFTNYGAYEYLKDNKISGLNAIVLKDFIEFSGISLSYKQYKSVTKLVEDFNSNKIDFMFDISNPSILKTNTFKTEMLYNEKLAIISGNNSNIVIDNLKSLIGNTVLTIKDSYIEQYLKLNGIKVKSYNNIDDMMEDFKNSDIVIVDIETYNFYKHNDLKNSRINSLVSINESYNFVINDIQSNKLFEDIFNFYLSFTSIENLVTNNYQSIVVNDINITLVLLIVVIVLIIYVAIDFYNHIKVMLKTLRKSKKINLTKEEKIMYIDQLTSLKNRAYLNSKIESWDESEVYPQSIIVIDLNNVSYVNDNYGREEGDKVITEAANILIQHQLSNSEIIRTDGNEFLIYLVGYNEKQIISYLRKLSKEFKGLSHGFGAASGYSIITDAIKTIDDAVNEATLAMKENKEDIEY